MAAPISAAMLARIMRGGHWLEQPLPDRRQNSRRPNQTTNGRNDQ